MRADSFCAPLVRPRTGRSIANGFSSREQPVHTRRVTSPLPAGLPDSLDGLDFSMVSSSASEVDPDAPTRFRYHQDGAMIWGEYTGDTVRVGRFVGTFADRLARISFVHLQAADGSLVTGAATSSIERRDDGLLYLVEDFEKDGVMHRSVCVQTA